MPSDPSQRSHKLLRFHILLHITPVHPLLNPTLARFAVPYKLLAELFAQPPTNHRTGPQECNISRKTSLVVITSGEILISAFVIVVIDKYIFTVIL